MIIGGSPMHAHRRMSSSPAHLRNSLQAIHHATRQQQQQQQQQSLQAAGSSPTLHRGTDGSGPSLQQQHQQRQQAAGSFPTTHRATVGAGPSLQQQQQRQQAAGSSPTMHCATVSDGAFWMRAGGPSPPPSRHRGDASDAHEGSPTLHRGTVGSGSSWMRAGGLSPPQPRQRDKAGGTYEGREAITAGLASPDADIGAPSPRQQDSGGVGPNSPTAAAALEGGLGTPPNHLPYHERRSGRPGGAIPLPTTPTSSRAKQRMHGDCLPVNSGAAWRGAITESSRGALAGAGGLGTPGAEDTATPRMARRRLQLGADLFGRAAEDGSGVDQQQQQLQQQQQSQSQQQQPQAQQQQPWLQQQQQGGPASLGARGSVSCGGTKGASQECGQDAKAQMDDGAARDLLVLDEHAEDMSAFDEEPMTVQVGRVTWKPLRVGE
ncbi:hypothetical protein DUNSADRAFT_10096 [Dunaliella salina]|uniref:Encoded protein n=1 Tax=Dunaliella salina TaxID=3046 RepID=A0ABQ7FSF0_DUNSA|nr:hypothetical protein DUNSADRAFT_10096 [Dunaliella salina]|eukprot:KAF5825429.1 hypothetical protein DUNSADRAFT_10096 [Dunaliella salina]